MKQQVAGPGGRAARRLCAARAARQAAPARTAAPAGDKQNAEALLIVEKVAKSHDGERMLFEGLTFTLARGERLSIVGENGAGKSTLLRILAGAARRPRTALQARTARPT
jgi:ATPase subunit of ABC transporter with duplicated ATPase domains